MRALDHSETPKFESIATEVLFQKSLLAKGTYALARIVIARLISNFGEMPLSDISEMAWQQYILLRHTKRPGCKLFDDKKFMNMILLQAYRRGFIARVPRLWIPDRPSTAGREITDAELTRLFAAANPELKFQMEIALKMGLRLREMLYLRWDRILWDEKAIRLRPEDTKARKGRVIPIPPELFVQFDHRVSCTKSAFVFPSRFDALRPQHDNKKAWGNLKTRTNVQTRWHDFRHTCASRLLRLGVPQAVARAYLGMTERVLTNIYQHLSIDDLRVASNAMSKSWKQ